MILVRFGFGLGCNDRSLFFAAFAKIFFGSSSPCWNPVAMIFNYKIEYVITANTFYLYLPTGHRAEQHQSQLLTLSQRQSYETNGRKIQLTVAGKWSVRKMMINKKKTNKQKENKKNVRTSYEDKKDEYYLHFADREECKKKGHVNISENLK